MTDKPDNPFQFWQELKRRKVIRVIPVYAAASFVLLELSSKSTYYIMIECDNVQL